MSFGDFETEEVPYWCLHCGDPAADVLALPEPVETERDIVYEVCESCFNELCKV